MSVVILGMEIPTVCIQGDWYGNCPMDRLWCAQRFAPKGMTMGQIGKEQQDKLPDWCPLRPLPEKHGALIDRTALEESVLKWLPPDPCGREEMERPFETDICVSMMMEIEEQETIVESEGY